MRILHTSDWHLGKTLENMYSRLEEQRQFLSELSEIATNESVDMIIVAGDVYDNANPSAEAEKLFYSSILALSDNGKRPVVIIAGNHDSPERLCAAASMAYEHGVLLVGNNMSSVPIQKNAYFEITESSSGYLKIKIKDETALVITLPYPNEKRLNEMIFNSGQESDMQRDYSDKVKDILQNYLNQNPNEAITIITSHLFVLGGESGGSERSLSLGGSLLVNLSALPRVNYTALGHLHRAQGLGKNIYYSGSPIQYDVTEANHAKLVYIADLFENAETEVKKVYLKNYKPIAVWNAATFDEALEILNKNADKNVWSYLNIASNLTMEEVKALRRLRDDVQIKMISSGVKTDEDFAEETTKKTLSEQFREFYKKQKNDEAPEDLVNLFLELAESGDF